MGRIIYILAISIFLIFTSCQKNKRYLVISKIKSTAKLATTETIIDKVVIGQKERKIFGLVKIGNAEFVAYSQAIVKTGIDLNKIKAKHIKIDGNIIELELPPIEVLDFAYPFQQYFIDSVLSDNDIFNKIDVIDQEIFFRKAEIDIRKHLKYMGITEQTQENTRKLMEGLLTNLGYAEIYISFADTTQLIQQVITDNN
ncbi:MAG: DUF4230 domain-containing protein [Bacteroidota bacterium]|nr:DUF4230 domain-containing protein [Bacteroidota bacterium]